MDHAGSMISKMYILFGPPTLGLTASQTSGGDAQMCLPSPASKVRPVLRPGVTTGLRRAWGGTGPSAQAQGGGSHEEPWPATFLGGWAHTAKSLSTLLFFPLGFLCVREPR